MTQVSGAERKSNNNGALITFYARFFICSILACLYSLMSSELIHLGSNFYCNHQVLENNYFGIFNYRKHNSFFLKKA